MKKLGCISSVLLLGVVGFVSSRAAPALGAAETIEFEDVKLIIEFNSTDQDVGIQAFVDGEPWKKLRIVDPNGHELVAFGTRGSVKKLGLTELFFESNEPELVDLPLEDFLELFPEGEYRFFGKTVEGDKLVGTAMFTHNIPDGPVILSPEEGEEVDPNDTVISWQAVVSPPGIQIAGYQVIVEDDAEHVLDAKLPADTLSLTVPPEFLQPATDYEFEVLAIEVGGNQTITQSSFVTE